MPVATILLRTEPAFRFDGFASGLEKSGYSIARTTLPEPSKDDLLVLWNRYPNSDVIARRYERAGATVLIAENGYLGREWRGGQWYALSKNHHNGAGTWPTGGPERWRDWNVDLAPWRNGAGETVILAQRGFGHSDVRQPTGWPQKALRALREAGVTARIRAHPGERGCGVPLEEDLSQAACCVTWSSGAALKALLMGIPVFHGFRHWIGAGAAGMFHGSVEKPAHGDRSAMFERLAWAMYSLEEIGSGMAFRCLLR